MPERSIALPGRWLILLVLARLPALAQAQGNYEIQVYGAATVPADNLMVELHSNFTVEGQTDTLNGVYPTNHQEHETLALTYGVTRVLSPGLDYYAGYGRLAAFASPHNQQQQMFVVTDLNVSPRWEIN